MKSRITFRQKLKKLCKFHGLVGGKMRAVQIPSQSGKGARKSGKIARPGIGGEGVRKLEKSKSKAGTGSQAVDG